MIKLMVVVCDACKKEQFSDGPKMPEGWRAVKWVEGLVVRPDREHIKSGRYHLCSPACLDKLFPKQSDAYGGE